MNADQQPTVSVLVTTYRHEPFIAQCLDSILEQRTAFPVEILVGEDGSDDGTRAICEAYAAQHPDRIRLFLNSRADVLFIHGKPTGRANAMMLMREARGRYIARCEGDDAWADPSKLQQQVDHLEAHPEHVMTYHDAAIVDHAGTVVQPGKMPNWAKRDFSGEELQRVEAFVLTLSLVHRNLPILRTLPEEFKHTSTGDNFLTSLLGAHGGGHYMPGIAPALYRDHGRGVWSSLGEVQRKRNQVNNFMWIGAYHGRMGNATLRDYFLGRAYTMVDAMVPWADLRHRKAYQLFARIMGWFNVTLPR